MPGITQHATTATALIERVVRPEKECTYVVATGLFTHVKSIQVFK